MSALTGRHPFFAFMRLFVTCLLIALALTGCRSVQPAERAPESQARDSRAGIGFASQRRLVEHYEKHGREFGNITIEEYLRRARELRDRPAGGEIVEIVRADGVITRFDRSSGAFLAFDPDYTIRTFFRPNDGEAYFQRQARRPQRPR